VLLMTAAAEPCPIPERQVPDPGSAASMRRFAEVSEAVAATTKKTEKVCLVAEYLCSLLTEEASLAAIFFTGQSISSLGGAGSFPSQAVSSGKAVERITSPAEAHAHAVYLKHGDLGDMAKEILQVHRANSRVVPPRRRRGVCKPHASAASNGQKLIAA